MKINEILTEMPVRSGKPVLDTKMSAYFMPASKVNQMYIIDITEDTALLLNDETSPTEGLFAHFQDNGGAIIFGYITFAAVPPAFSGKKAVVIRVTNLDAKYQGKGFATMAYEALMNNGFIVVSDMSQSDAAVKLWRGLAAQQRKMGITVQRVDISGGKIKPVKITGKMDADTMWDEDPNTRFVAMKK